MVEIETFPVVRTGARGVLSRPCSGWVAAFALAAFLADLWLMVYWVYTVNA
ncbi:MAG: hypothetical protein IT514_02475 [Burkholderiales bacterium]|nr:hypothetical protein [Burkholderiales bacterium]